MESKYDEDVYENPFFSAILSNYPDYLEKAVTSKGTLCVPKYSLASLALPSKEDVEDHLLLPTKEIVDDADDFVTVSGKTVHIGDGHIVIQDGTGATRKVKVLFAETFHSDNGGSYRIFCIEGFLNKTVEKPPGEASPTKSISPTSYQQCMDILWSHSGGQKMRESLDKILNTFAATYDRLEGETLRSIVDAANTHFTKAMQLLLKDSVVRRSARYNPQYMENLKIAVETYVMNAVHKQLFRVITATMAGADAEINKINRNLVDLQLSDLGIRKIFSQNILPAKKEISLLNRYSTPMGRLFCVKRVVAALTKPPKKSPKEASKDSAAMMSTDDLLPILIFLIIKSEIPNWMANLVYMKHFHFAKSSDDDEFGFYLASVEAAIEHIRSGNIKDEIKPLLKRERWNSILITDPADGTSTSSSPPSPLARQISHIDEFFRLVQEGDEKTVQQMLERPHKTSEEIHLKLCHPLCSCDKCDKLLSTLRNNSDLVTAYTRDNRGYTALHMAAYYGQGLLIDLLIQSNAVVDSTDYLGLTPLHLACQRGYQNVMLLLLHFGADIMATDNEGNTPLHLCCANGHEDCVKALVFYDANMKKLQINTANEFGDTPLHLAAKWGYESIVKTLLENGADSTLCNRIRQTPVSLAQNVKVQRWLQMAAEGLDLQPVRPQFVSPNAKSRSSSASSGSTQNSTYTGSQSGALDIYEPESSPYHVETASLEAASETERRRKKEKLFKAIMEGDIQLVKFYLGIQSEHEDYDDDDNIPTPPSSDSLKDMCHPLCQCDKCLSIQKATRKAGGTMNVNTKTSTGYCPIHIAVLHNHCDIISLLISLKADVSAQNHKSLTPLHLACCTRNSLITDMLLKAGAKIEVHDMNGDTPLLIAASNGFINGVQILLKSGANLNATNMRGNTALHEALKRDQNEVAVALLHAGADTRIENKHGKLPVQFTDDPAMQAMVMSATFKLNEAELKLQRKTTAIGLKKKGTKENQISIKDLFAAFEEKDLHTLQSLAASIRSFDPKVSLRRTKTLDRSAPRLDGLARRHSIVSFDRGSLRKVKSLDKTDPLHIYALSQSNSFDDRLADNLHNPTWEHQFLSPNEQLTPMGDSNPFELFSSFDDPSASLAPIPEPCQTSDSSGDKSGQGFSSDSSQVSSSEANIPSCHPSQSITKTTSNQCDDFKDSALTEENGHSDLRENEHVIASGHFEVESELQMKAKSTSEYVTDTNEPAITKAADSNLLSEDHVEKAESDLKSLKSNEPSNSEVSDEIKPVGSNQTIEADMAEDKTENNELIANAETE